MIEKPAVRIFISSPSDVRPERLLAERIIARLDREFSYHFHVEAILWEREPLVATHHFQDPLNIPRPRTADIVVVILWSRLGLLLPEAEFRGAISGGRVTGTEWEFEDALDAARRQNGVPSLLVYRKHVPVTASLDDEAALDEMRRQKKALETFVGRWFGSAENGDIVAASHTYASIAEFEDELYEHLSALLERRVGSLPERSAIRWHDAPFRGLRSFDLEHAPIFFGRTRARNDVRELLAKRVAAGMPLVIVSGASGSGKSSLAKAGLLPDLMLPGMLGRVALCRHAIVRPSGALAPLHGLAEGILSETALPELRGLHYDPERLASLLREAPGQAALPIEQGLAAAAKSADLVESADARLVLIVDQFEEAFAAGASEAGRREWVAALVALAKTRLVWVVATIRGDFLDRLGEFPDLTATVNADGHYFLSEPTEAELGQIIRRPAREAGLRFAVNPTDGSSLDETIRESAARDPNVLPLLSFVLDELWRERSSTGELTFEAYAALGGLEGALASRAESVFEGLPPAVRAALPRVLRALVNVEDGTRITSRPAPLARFASASSERALIDAFAAPDARLLVTDGDDAASTVRVAHEALFTHWRRAADQLTDDRADLELTTRLRAEAARRAAAPADAKAALLLAPGLPLEEARSLLARRRDELDGGVVAYVTASSEADRRRVSVRRTRVIWSFVGLGALVLFALWQWRSAVSANATAAAQQSHFLAIDSASAVDSGNPVLGTLLALEALPKDVAHPDRPFASDAEDALQYAMLNQRQRLQIFVHKSLGSLPFPETPFAARFSSDGRRIVTASYPLDLRAHDILAWDAATGRSAPVRPGDDADGFGTHLPDTRRTPTGTDPSRQGWIPFPGAAPPVGVLSPDGTRTVVVLSVASIVDVRTHRTLATLPAQGTDLNSVAFSPDGSQLVTTADDGSARIFDARTGALQRILAGHSRAVNDAVFSPDGTLVATASDDRSVRVWRASDGAPREVLLGHDDKVVSVAFSPDSRRLVSASADLTVRVWDAVGGDPVPDATDTGGIALSSDPNDSARVVAFAPDLAHYVVREAEGGTLRSFRFDAARHALEGGPALPVRCWHPVFSRDGSLVACAGAADVIVRDAATGATVATLTGAGGLRFDDAGALQFDDAAFSADDTRIAIHTTGRGSRTHLAIWAARGDAATPIVTFGFPGDGDYENAEVGSLDLRFSPDGSRLAVIPKSGRPCVLDAADGAVVSTIADSGLTEVAGFTPDGEQIVMRDVSSNGKVYDARNGQRVATLGGQSEDPSPLELSPDGTEVVGGTRDGRLLVWDTQSGDVTAHVAAHDGAVRSIAFAPGATGFVTSSIDDTIRTWPLLRGQALIDAARASVPERLSDDQRARELLPTSAP